MQNIIFRSIAKNKELRYYKIVNPQLPDIATITFMVMIFFLIMSPQHKIRKCMDINISENVEKMVVHANKLELTQSIVMEALKK